MAGDNEGRSPWDAEVVDRLTWRAALHAFDNEFGRKQAVRLSRTAGLRAGNEYARDFMDLNADFRTFALSLQKALADLGIDTLRIESFNPDTGNLVITGEEIVDRDGLSESVYVYDRSFVDGILEVYTGQRCDGWDV